MTKNKEKHNKMVLFSQVRLNSTEKKKYLKN